MGRSRCRGTRKAQLQLLAAATMINLKRLLAAADARTGEQTGHERPTHATIASRLDLLTGCQAALDRLTAIERPTGS